MLFYCDADAGLRYHHFEVYLLNPIDCSKVQINKILQFIQDAGLWME